jgi:hypothetical protein
MDSYIFYTFIYPVIILVTMEVAAMIILTAIDKMGSVVSLIVNCVTEIVEVMEDIKRDQRVFNWRIIRNSIR